MDKPSITAPSPPETDRGNPNWTIAENQYSLCAPEELNGSEEFRKAAQDYAKFQGQWDQTFLNQVLDFSIQQQSEVGILIQLDRNTQHFGITMLKGEAGFLQQHDVWTIQTVLHTHPRQTHESAPITAFSPNDLFALIGFSLFQNQPAVATVISKICGGPLEVDQIAISGSTIYVTSEIQKKWIGNILERTPLPQPLRDVMKQLESRDPFKSFARQKQNERFSLVVDPQKVNNFGVLQKNIVDPFVEEVFKNLKNNSRPD